VARLEEKIKKELTEVFQKNKKRKLNAPHQTLCPPPNYKPIERRSRNKPTKKKKTQGKMDDLKTSQKTTKGPREKPIPEGEKGVHHLGSPEGKTPGRDVLIEAKEGLKNQSDRKAGEKGGEKAKMKERRFPIGEKDWGKSR